MSSFEILKSKYKPYKYTINKNVKILESTSGKFVIKGQNKDLFTLFNYLENRGFTSFPKLIYNYENKENVFEYVEDDKIPNEQKLIDLASTLASLHNKTVYFKKVSPSEIINIKEIVEENLDYINISYEGMLLSALKDEYQSPSNYFFTRNYFKIKEAINFCREEINNWYEDVKDLDKIRVSVVNNNLELEHFFKTKDNEYLISWDNYLIDTPILDFVSLYQKEGVNYDFSAFLEKYLSNFELLDYEKKLMFILISIPKIITIEGSEINKTKIVKENIKYIFNTEKLIGPYFSK